jgi:ABC-type transporter Mla MlaB component
MEPRTISFAVYGPIARADLPGLCRRLCSLLSTSGASLALCDVRTVAADAVVVDALARMQLAARRCGAQVRLLHASEDLSALIALMGLADVVAEATPRGAPATRTAETDDPSRGRS